MKTLVCIQGHAAAQATISMNLPFWQKSGCDLLGLEGDDSLVPCWPDCVMGVVTSKATKGKWCGYGLHPTRLIHGMDAVLNTFSGYDAYLWTECDSIFTKALPDRTPTGLEAFIAGYCPPEWKSGTGPFLHPPFWMTRDNWKRWLKAKIASKGNGTTDVLAAIIADRAKIPITSCEGAFSVNGLDMRVASKLVQAKEAYQSGAWHIHGVKRQDHLDYIIGNASHFPEDTIME